MQSLIVALALFAGPPAEPTMSGAESVEVGQYARLDVSGVPLESLPQADVTIWPENGTEKIEAQNWSGQPYILFRSSVPGEYLVKVVAPILDGKVATLIVLRHVIEVRGPPAPPVPPQPPEPPTPPPGPDPPQPPQTTGVAYVMVIRRNQELTADQAEVLIKLRTWSDARQQQVSHLEFDPDTAGDNGQLWAAKVPAGETLPYWFLARQRTGSTGVAILNQGPLPDSLDAITGAVEGVLK